MQKPVLYKSAIWTLTGAVVAVALFVWWPSGSGITLYSIFPLLGLTAFSLMWVHYIASALRRFFRLPDDINSFHYMVTSYLVLILILSHPFIFYIQLYLDGLGLPYQSIPAVYPGIMQRIAVFAGVVALIIFLAYELNRFFHDRSWWRWVERANIGAMFIILWHGFTLGGELREPWFQVVWITYAVVLLYAVAYTGYSKRKESLHGSTPVA